MNRTSMASLTGILLLSACELFDRRPKADPVRAAAAANFTKRYSQSHFAEWHVRARPAGSDCTILLIDTGVLMTDERIDAVEFGVNASEIVEGGAHGLAHDAKFRAVVYRDSGDKIWVRDGAVPNPSAVTPCR